LDGRPCRKLQKDPGGSAPSCYPMPHFEDIASKLNGCTVFSVIDLKDAYLRLPVAEEARKYLTIVTHKGYFRYNRLPFGVTFAPALFQECMDKVLSGLERSIAYLDDIICGSLSTDTHMDDVRQTMMRLKNAGLRSEQSKCRLFQTTVPFLGHIIDSHGVHPAEDKLEVMHDLRAPWSSGLLSEVYSEFADEVCTVHLCMDS